MHRRVDRRVRMRVLPVLRMACKSLFCNSRVRFRGRAAGSDAQLARREHPVMPPGAYPAPGITLGPGLVFAYLASQDAFVRKVH